MITPEENGSATPDPEVTETAKRRRFSASYKLDILKRWERETGAERGAMLRGEGLYRSHISKWLEQREAGALVGLAPRKRGRKAKERHPAEREVEKLRRENARLERGLKRAVLLIEIQKKVSEALGIPLKGLESEDDENN